MTYPSVAHLVDFESKRLVVRQPFKVHVLRTNLKHLFVFLFWGCLQTLAVLSTATGQPQEPLVDQLHDLRDTGFRLFNIVDGHA